MRIRVYRLVLLLIVLSANAVVAASGFASDLKIRVLDPRGAAVLGAQVALYTSAGSLPVALATSNASGMVVFPNADSSANYRVRILAAGFAGSTVAITPENQREVVSVELKIASAGTTVVVSADRTPLPAEESSALTESLNFAQLETMRPTSTIEALRFLPGATVSIAGRRGGQASLFVRGGDSRYNKVIVDGVVINDPGGTFDFGVVPTEQLDRIEFVRGAESALYGSDAMTSVVEMSSRNGSTRVPELTFGASGGTFETADGFLSLAGARGRFDYNLFGDEFHTQGQGVNDGYFNALQGGNVGVQLSRWAAFRLRLRHSNNRSGVQSFWNFNGQPLVPPDADQFARQNNFLASGQLTLNAPRRFQHRITGFEYNHRRENVNPSSDPARVSPLFGFNFDTPFNDYADYNRAGLEYQGDFWARDWARNTFGYRFEDENGFVGDRTTPPLFHALRRNHAVYDQQVLTLGRATLIGGIRWEHNEEFGDRAIPRASVSFLALRGGEILSGTRLRFGYGQGIKEPRLEETFGLGGFGLIPNPALKPEENRSLEAGFEQNLFSGKADFTAIYYNNLFRNQIAFNFDPVTFVSQYVNLNKALAHGAEVELHARPWTRVSFTAAYVYTSSQVLQAPESTDPLTDPGAPLVRRPRHSGSLMATYTGQRWGGSLTVVAVGRRPDSDFGLGLLPPVTHSAGYARVDVGLWRQLNRHMTAFLNLENITNRKYEEAAGYPALKANFRAGMRFRVGGE